MTLQLVFKSTIVMRGKPDATGFARSRNSSTSSKNRGAAQLTLCSRLMTAAPVVTEDAALFVATTAASSRPLAALPALKSP